MQRSPVLLSVLIGLCVLGLTACRSGSASIDRMVWTPREAHVTLQRGNYVSGSYCPNICPCLPDNYVFRRDGTKVTSFASLQPLLRPIDTKEVALAYRALLRDVRIERDPVLKKLQHSADVDFHEGERAFFGVYTETERERWGIGKEQVVEALPDRIVITGPRFWQDMTQDSETQQWTIGVARVELTRETIYPDGTYECEVLRVLEEGKRAEVHQPAPLL